MIAEICRFLARVKMWIGSKLILPAIRTENAALIAIVFWFIARPMGGRRRYRVMTVTKDVFEEDAIAMAEFGQAITHVLVRAGTIKALMVQSTGPLPADIDWRSFHVPGRLDVARDRHYRFLIKVLPAIRMVLRLDGIMVCSFQYTYFQDIGRACRELGIPYVIMHKEAMMVPQRVGETIDYMKRGSTFGDLHVDRMLLLNETAADMMRGLGIPGLSSESIHATGPARLDRYRLQPPIATLGPRKKLLYFASEPRADFYHFKKVWSDIPNKWEKDLRSEFLDALRTQSGRLFREIVRFATLHPDVDVVVKIKKNLWDVGRAYVRDQIRSALMEFSGSSEAPNLTISDAWIAQSLIESSTAVIALNSTTVVEAILRERIVLTPDYSAMFPDGPWNYFADYPALTTIFSTTADIERAMFAPAPRSPDWAVQREAFVRRYAVAGVSESSSALIERNLVEVIERRTA
jgi:hypothetical protein